MLPALDQCSASVCTIGSPHCLLSGRWNNTSLAVMFLPLPTQVWGLSCPPPRWDSNAGAQCQSPARHHYITQPEDRGGPSEAFCWNAGLLSGSPGGRGGHWHRPSLTRLWADKEAARGWGSPLRHCSPGAAQVHLARVQLHVLLFLEDAVNHRLQDLVQVRHTHELRAGGTTWDGAEGEAGACTRAGAGGTVQGGAQSEAEACPRAGVGGALQVHLRAKPAKLWGPGKHRKGVPLRKLQLAPAFACSPS